MSIKSEWKKVETWWKAWWNEVKRAHLVDNDPNKGTGYDYPYGATAEAPKAEKGLPVPSLASCWEGSNAQTRHMNELSFAFTDEQVEKRLDWAVERGCNTVHWFVCNQADGEGAGYNIYSGEPTLGKVDEYSVSRMLRSIAMAHDKGLSVVLWLMADDSARWNKALLSDPARYAADLKRSGLLDLADAVVLGLELDEYANKGQVEALASAVRGVYDGKIGTHHTSGKADYAKYGDFLCWQTKTGLDEAAVKRSVEAAKKHGKPVIAFELERNPAREKAQAALDAGAVGVGNW